VVRKVIGGLIALGLVLPALVMVGGSASAVGTSGTSTYTATGDVVSASLCESRTGKLSLVTGAQYSL